MSSKWLDQARANREVAQQIRQAAPGKAEVARLTMLRYAQLLEREAQAFEEHAFEAHVEDVASSLPAPSKVFVH